MKGRLALISTAAACVLATPAALAAPSPPGAVVRDENASCVGLFAAFNAPLGPGISQEAGPGFGSMVVAPFAHERLPCP
ncbi:MAG TPA: hypothetical protein VHF67_08140 [Gaiellaceae bacterium]|jgi:hypothetical protein|nr:hypothetical protein [Gaiellaceae bacterium]